MRDDSSLRRPAEEHNGACFLVVVVVFFTRHAMNKQPGRKGGKRAVVMSARDNTHRGQSVYTESAMVRFEFCILIGQTDQQPWR